MADQPTCLCIVSRDRLRGSDFLAALRETLGPHDQLEIIVDRRSGEPMGEWERLQERRHRPQVDLALRANGFAVVPVSGSSSNRMSSSDRMLSSDRIPSSGRVGGADRVPGADRIPGADRLGSDRMSGSERVPGLDRLPSPDRNWPPENDDRDWTPSNEGRSRSRLSLLLPSTSSERDVSERDVNDDDEERLEAIRDFKRERAGGLVPWLVVALIVAAAAAFLLSPTGQTVRNSLTNRISPTAPSSSPAQATNETGAPGPVAQKPSPPEPAAPRDAGAVGSPRENNTAATGSPSTGSTRPSGSAPGVGNAPTVGSAPPTTNAPPPGNAPTAAGTAANSGAAPSTSALPSASAPSVDGTRTRTDSTAPPREMPDGSRTRSTATEAPRPSSPSPRETARAIPAPDSVSRTIAPRFAGLPRVELIREGNGTSGAYSVKIADPAGKPLSDAEVLLIARMADGTLENVRMGFVPEQGTYRGVLPPVRSAPVDMRIRVITGDKRVEIPLGP